MYMYKNEQSCSKKQELNLVTNQPVVKTELLNP